MKLFIDMQIDTCRLIAFIAIYVQCFKLKVFE